MAQQPQQPQQQQSKESGLVVFEGYDGLDTQPTRYGVADKKCFIMDGFFPAGNSNARTIYDNGPAIGYFDGGIIIYFQFANILGVSYAIVFLTDGSIWAMPTSTGIATIIAPGGTIQNPSAGQGIGVSQWGSTYILIVANQQPNGYFVWDGTTFYVTGDTVPGEGVVPSVIYGTSLTTFQGYVWIIDGSTLTWSAPGSFTDFSTSSGGGALVSTDSSLRAYYTKMVSSNGYLYVFGDSSDSYISGVLTSGSPPATSFSFQNVDPEVGTVWPDSVQVLGSNIVFANAWGVHVSYGGRAAKVSSELDGIYNSVTNFGGLVASSAKAIVFGKRVYVLLLCVMDQVTLQQVTKLFLWDEKRWCSASQSASLTFIASEEINSTLTAWGTDSRSLYRLFQTPSTGQIRTLQSKFWAPGFSYADIKAESRIWGLVQIYSGGATDVSVSIDSERGSSPIAIPVMASSVVWTNDDNVVVFWTNSFSLDVVWSAAGLGTVVLPPTAGAQQGALVGITLQTTAPDLGVISLATMPVSVAYRG